MTSAMHARKAKLKTQLVSAKARLNQHVTPRRVVLLAATACSSFLILLTLRTLNAAAAAHGAGAASSAASTPPSVAVHDSQQQHRECGKVPAAVADALVHYATSNATPRLTAAEAGAAARVLARRAPCNLLVFGLDAGGALWAALNHGGRTLFLDADAEAIAAVRAARPAGLDLDAHTIAYQEERAASLAADADELLALRDSPDCTGATTKHALSPDHLERSPCKLAPRALPPAFYEAEWDVIMVNAPPAASAIYAAGVAARVRRRPGAGETTTDVLVHGVDAPGVERFTRAFLCEGYIKEEAGRTRHFAVPSHSRDKEAVPFCP